jgi:UDP-glucose 4-epimerase
MNEDEARAEERYRAENVEVTRRLAEAAQRAGVQRFLFVSSIKVNGEGGTKTIRADDAPMPSDAYARSKCEAEALLRRLTATGDMKHIIFRPPLMYGPGVKANMYALLRWVDRRRPWPFGAMENGRSLLFVGNMADAIVTALAGPRAVQKTYLLADGPPVSTSDILRAVAVAMEQPILMAPLSGKLAGRLLALAGRQDLRRRLFGSLVVDGAPFCEDTGWTPPSSLADGLKALDTLGYADPKRVAIEGWSFGGFMSAYALTHSDMFKVGIAGAGVMDWQLYDTIYTERYMGTPQKNAAGYKAGSVVAGAAKLNGNLLIVHGMMDDNVHVQNSMQLIYALQKAGKKFDMMLYPSPSSRHGIGDPDLSKHNRELRLKYLVEKL